MHMGEQIWPSDTSIGATSQQSQESWPASHLAVVGRVGVGVRHLRRCAAQPISLDEMKRQFLVCIPNAHADLRLDTGSWTSTISSGKSAAFSGADVLRNFPYMHIHIYSSRSETTAWLSCIEIDKVKEIAKIQQRTAISTSDARCMMGLMRPFASYLQPHIFSSGCPTPFPYTYCDRQLQLG